MAAQARNIFGAEFFPTPPSIIHRMLAKVDKEAVNFLEPSAGKGDIALAILGNKYDHNRRKVDCIEIEPELVSVLRDKELTVVGHDWLTYTGVCFYDVVILNPPYSNGVEHCLKAWDFMHDGEIVCLLNEETIKNPHTADRKRLAALIEQHGDVEYLGDCFRTAQRPTGVNVAMVYLKKKSDDDLVDLWSANAQEKAVDDNIGGIENMLAIPDELGNMEHFYNMAAEHMLKAFQHLRKSQIYLQANGIGNGYAGKDYKDIAGMAMANVNAARAEFARKHRRDSWVRVFEKMQFRKWLDKKQTDEFLRDIETNANIPFTADNIKGTLENILLQRNMLFEKSVANVFDELTRHHKENTVTEGWKSNDNYKVNLKLVFPYGCEFDSIFNRFRTRYSSSSIDIYNDLDRILCVLDHKPFEDCWTIYRTLDNVFKDCRSPGTCESEYFEIRFFKKGTIHLKWKRKDLHEQFNLTAAKGKMWIGSDTAGRHKEGSRG